MLFSSSHSSWADVKSDTFVFVPCPPLSVVARGGVWVLVGLDVAVALGKVDVLTVWFKGPAVAVAGTNIDCEVVAT